MTRNSQAKVQIPYCRVAGAGLLAVLLAACGGGGGGGGETEAVVSSVVSNGVIEGDTGSRDLEITVTLDKPAVNGVTVSYSTSANRAPLFGFAKSTAQTPTGTYEACGEVGADYIPAGGSVTIPKGQSSGVIRVTICSDTTLEPNESFTVTWYSPGQSQTVTAVILNDEPGALASTGLQSSSPALASSGSYVSRDDNPLTNDAVDGPAGLAYAKLNAAGTEQPITDATWTCLKDKVTGLVWLGGDALSATTTTWDTVSTAAGTTCGRSDWRLPTVSELLSLLNNASSAGSAFTAMQSGRYWTGDSSTANAQAWYVDFGSSAYGLVGLQNKSSVTYARLVSDPVTAPQSRFQTSGNVVIDNKTQLMWKRCPEGADVNNSCAGTRNFYVWTDIASYVSNLNAGSVGSREGYSDWRLPNKNELASLLTTASAVQQPAYPAFDATYFPSTNYGQASSYWTATAYATGTGDRKYYVDFYDRSVGPSETNFGMQIRLVRGGQ